MKKVTVLGGGTGTFVVLSGLKKYNLDIAVIVSMMDSGGSTGRLRDQLGVLPPGDLRQCLVALSEAPLFWRKLFLYRFEKGDLAGHNFGNIFLSALEKVTANYSQVIHKASYILQIKGRVIPVTFDKTHLCVEYENKKVVKGEGNIDSNYSEKSRVKRAYLEPSVETNPVALKRINESNYIIVGPGDLYASIIPVLLTEKVKKNIKESKAKIIYNMNLMTKSGQTTNYKASDHIKDLTEYLGREPNIVILNNGKIPPKIIEWYRKDGEKPVENDLLEWGYKGKIVKADIIDKRTFLKSEADQFADPMVRSILRHDPVKIAKIITKTIGL